MKRTLITAVALAACATQLLAQNVKEGNITFALTETHQASISTSGSAKNAGNWSQRPRYYKTATAAINTRTILDCIGYVLHGNAGYYTKGSLTVPAAKLVLVQGELGGFFNILPELADNDSDLSAGGNNDGLADPTLFNSTLDATFVRLATGRHFRPVPLGFATEGNWPPGHHQPWGQIFVKSQAQSICDNVTPFFAITVVECYDCFYLSSFVTASTFTLKPGGIQQQGPPCCSIPIDEELGGCGTDKYYMTFSFDNTYNNPYLNDENDAWAGKGAIPTDLYYQVVGLQKLELTGDGLTPDQLQYVDRIISLQGAPSPYELRFTLNGIVTYKWCLKRINSTDVALDFLGTAKYDAYGYSFYQLLCGVVNGSISIAESAVNSARIFCCANEPWYDDWYGIGWNNQQYPWDTYFGSPINVPASLALHVGVNEFYEPRWQWPQSVPEPNPALPDEQVDTRPDPLDGGVDKTYIPGTRWYNLGGN
jgi:hypothetical protein